MLLKDVQFSRKINRVSVVTHNSDTKAIEQRAEAIALAEVRDKIQMALQSKRLQKVSKNPRIQQLRESLAKIGGNHGKGAGSGSNCEENDKLREGRRV